MFIISDVFIYSTLSLGQGVCIVYCYLMVITNSGAGSGLLKRSRLAIFNLRPVSSTIEDSFRFTENSHIKAKYRNPHLFSLFRMMHL